MERAAFLRNMQHSFMIVTEDVESISTISDLLHSLSLGQGIIL